MEKVRRRDDPIANLYHLPLRGSFLSLTGGGGRVDNHNGYAELTKVQAGSVHPEAGLAP